MFYNEIDDKLRISKDVAIKYVHRKLENRIKDYNYANKRIITMKFKDERRYILYVSLLGFMPLRKEKRMSRRVSIRNSNRH